ncbi:MAG TPA: response regulator transcription factor [Anaerolineales bacterium]|nr:response regulator transcription factor [Anaerolineales bacterium]
MSQRILVVDDEASVTDLIAYNLRKALYDVRVAADGSEALRLAREYQPDLILLDLMIPEVDGLDVCRELRKSSDVPVIMITARGEELDRVLGLEIGADDYVTKPFSVRELMARIKAVLRRPLRPLQPLRGQKDGEVEPSTLVRGPGNLLMDIDRRSVMVGDTSIELTRLEFDLLHRLLINPGRVLTRERLLEQAWGYEYVGDTRAVDSAVKRLRAKLRVVSAEADCIESVRGLGYRIN